MPDDSAFTMHDNREMNRKKLTRLFLDSYKEKGDRNEAWDEAALASIDIYIKFATERQELISRRERMETAKKPLEAGCADPIVLYAYAHAHDGYSRDVEEVLVKAIEQYRSGDYPGYCGMVAAQRLARRLIKEKREDEVVSVYDFYFEQCIRAIKNKEIVDEEIRAFYVSMEEAIRETPSRDRVREWLDRIAKLKDADPWLVHMCNGYLDFKLGWDVRGAGFSGTVTDEGWQGFDFHHNRAYFSFRNAYELAPQRPESATLLIDVAMGGHSLKGQDHYYWFERAMEAQFDWISAYNKLLHAVRPRWHGSLREMYELGLYAKRTERYDTKVPQYFLHVLREIAFDDESIDFWRNPDVYQEVKEMIEPLIENEPPRDRFNPQNHYRTMQLIFAWAAGDYEDAVKVRSMIKQFDSELLRDYGVRRNPLLEEIYAYTSNVGSLIKDADVALQYENVYDALDHYRLALKGYEKGKNEPRGRNRNFKYATHNIRNVREVLNDRIAGLQVYLDFNEGDWVDLTFDESLSGWWAEAGSAVYVDERTIELQARGKGLQIYHRAPIGRHWEMAGEIDLTKSNQKNYNNAGIISSVLHRHPKADYQRVEFYERIDSLRLRRAGRISEKIEVPIEGAFKFHVQFWGDLVVVNIDEKQVYAGPLPTEGRTWWPGPFFGLGGYYRVYNNRIFYSDLRIRRLDDPPPGLDEFLEELENEENRQP